ncbi:MAG: tRNA (adenosine(37)-N6)-threonylcarbamoyltransferase complex transferase subunit TsaD [Planctomycetota bacterium]
MFRQLPESRTNFNILCLETTCDETAAAIISQELEVLGSVVATQEKLHEEFSGVVPEIAARAHVERILPVIDQTLRQSKMELSELDAVAVANTPGLSGSLLVGVVAAKTLAVALGIPLIAVNHLHAHVYACQLDADESIYPCIGMVVSGGHTHLYQYEDALTAVYLGGTIDDAAGEAFDKVASMLGLPYPGGPAISKKAVDGDSKAYDFPRSFLNEERLDFSFSGLKTAVRYAIAGPGEVDFEGLQLEEKTICDVAASFQQAVVDCLVHKALQAAKTTNMSTLCVGGGVAANRSFRDQLAEACQRVGITLRIAPLKYCTDNAVMGAIAIERYRAGLFESLDLDIQPGLIRH